MIKIAICDDLPIMREIIEYCIHFYEGMVGTTFEIQQFAGGEDLINIYSQADSFDLLFLDQSMKKLTGLETAAKIRQAHTDSCSIVFVTSSDSYHQFKPVQPLDIIKKPVSLDAIGRVLAQVIETRNKAQRRLNLL